MCLLISANVYIYLLYQSDHLMVSEAPSTLVRLVLMKYSCVTFEYAADLVLVCKLRFNEIEF